VTYVCIFHVVFRPKYRRKVLVPPVDARLKEIVHEQCAVLRQDLLAVEVQPDHVHVLVGCDLQFGIQRLVKHLKGVSSRFLRQAFPALKRRSPSLWTNSYYVATTGGAPLAYIKQYVASQKQR
jgi:putative transposase